MEEWQGKTDEQLASASSTGGNGQIAAIEMLRRVKLSNAELRATMIEVRLDLYGRWLPMAAPEGALDRLGASLCWPECNESATNEAPTPTLATGTYGVQ